MKYLLLFLFVPLLGQELHYNGERVHNLTEAQAIDLLTKRDAEWQLKIDTLKAENLELLKNSDSLSIMWEAKYHDEVEEARVDKLTLIAKSARIEALEAQNDANIKLMELSKKPKPKWYQNSYLWLLSGLMIGNLVSSN